MGSRKLIDLKGKPFYLDEQDMEWIESCLKDMDITEKVGQLFCPISIIDSEHEIKSFLKKFKPSGIIYKFDNVNKIQNINRILQADWQIPLLIFVSNVTGEIGFPLHEINFGKHMHIDGVKQAEIMSSVLTTDSSNDFLKEKLDFNGLITADLTEILRASAPENRAAAVPKVIASGCDMLLYSENIAEDFSYIIQGMIDGILSKERLDEAVKRILAFKAALGLHKRRKLGTLEGFEALQRCCI